MSAVKKMRLVPYTSPTVPDTSENVDDSETQGTNGKELNALDTAMSDILKNDTLSDGQKIAKYTETMQSHLSQISEEPSRSYSPSLAESNENGKTNKKVSTKPRKASHKPKSLLRKITRKKPVNNDGLKLDFSKRWLQWNEKV